MHPTTLHPTHPPETRNREEYHTGIMVYGNRYYGVLEANYSICAVHIATAVWGAALWRAPAPLPAALLQWWASAAGGAAPPPTVADAALVAVSAAGVAQAAGSIARVSAACFRNDTSPPPRHVAAAAAAGHKQRGLPAALLHLVGLALTLAVGAWSIAWAAEPCNRNNPSHASESSTTCTATSSMSLLSAATSCRTAVSMFGLLYALTATQLILAHMCKEPWAPSCMSLGLPLLHVGSVAAARSHWVVRPGRHWPTDGSLLGLVDPLAVLHAVAALAYAHYGLSAISLICDYLGIACLRIAPTAAGAGRRK
jgi:ethanolaminephosphotransferase